MRLFRLPLLVLVWLSAFSIDSRSTPFPHPQPAPFDVVIRGGTVYDGTGAPGRRADVGIRGDRIAGVGDLSDIPATTTIDAAGLAVAPGFINMLSWSTESLLVDGRSQGELREGVTTQIFGEGSSMGPLTPEMKRRATEQMGDIEVLDHMDRPVGVPEAARGAGHLTERRVVHRRHDDPGACHRPRGQASNPCAT